MVKDIIDDLGLDMYEDNETTSNNLELIDDLLTYIHISKRLQPYGFEYVFKHEYKEFYSNTPHKIIDEYAGVYFIKLKERK